MSELIAEARVLVTPDTTKFRSLLTAELAAAAKGVTVPITVTPVVATSGGIGQIGTAASAAGAELTAADRIARQFGVTTIAVSEGAAKAAAALEVEAAAAQTASVGLNRTGVASAQIARVNEQLAVTTAAFAKAQESTITPLVASRRASVALAEAQKLMQVTSQGAAVAQERLVASLAASVAGFHEQSVATVEAAAAQRRLATQTAATATTQAGLARGAGSAAASLLGVRGATLAATGPFIAGAAAAISLSKAIGIATGFNQQLSVFAATTGATADEMDRVSVSAQQLGKDLTLPGVSASDAAEAMTEFAKAGLSVNDAIAATRGGLQLATAAQLSNADAVELTANALNAFKLSGDQAVSVADTLANAANAAQGSIADIGLGLKQAAGAAAVVGVSFEDTTALLTLLAKNGLTASDAGTSLRTAFIRLVNPSKQAQKILTDLNVQLRDAQGNVRPEVFAEFADAQKDLAVSTQQANAAIVFGQDAFRAFGTLSREGASGLANVRSELDQTGTAARIAGARMTGVAGATANLKNQLESLGLTIGQVTAGPLADILNQLSGYAAAAQVATTKSVGLAKAIGGIADAVPAGGFLVDVSKTAFKFGNVIGQINTAKNLLTRGGDDVAKEAEKTGVEIRDAIESASREAAKGAESFGDQITGALDDAFALINKSLDQSAKNLRAGQFAAVARAGGRQAGLEEALNQIVGTGGSDQEQIANLRRQAAVQAKIIETAGPGAAGELLKARRVAQEKLASINQQIVAVEKGIAADQQDAQDELQRVRAQAKTARDQTFLQTQENARTAQERLVSRASDTEGLRDDIQRQQQLHDLLQRQITSLKASAVDEDTKQKALTDLRNARNATTDEIVRLRATDKRQRQEQRQQAQEALSAARLELGQATFDLTGNRSILVKAIDAEVKRQIALKNAAKKGSLAFILAQTEIRNLLKRRKDLFDTIKQETDSADTTGGTTLVDLFNRAQDILGGAGNVGQTAQRLRDLSANTQIKAQVQQRLDIVNDPAKAAAARQVASTDRLIVAIDLLTQTLTGNTASGTPITHGERNSFKNLSQEQRFFYQKQARLMVEQGLVG